ncbi:hypothetical protein J7297_00099 [Nakaseomyces glabratus]|nr:hypothetical protein J7297_00099 [Nakaseomyces glabratus]KAH7598873.1 hypothetical protein J7296_00094 [Nakaseomyces glabratus]
MELYGCSTLETNPAPTLPSPIEKALVRDDQANQHLQIRKTDASSVHLCLCESLFSSVPKNGIYGENSAGISINYHYKSNCNRKQKKKK